MPDGRLRRTAEAPVLAHAYIVTTMLAVGMCMTCVLLAVFVVWKSQKMANELSVRHTVAIVRTLKTQIMATYFVGNVGFRRGPARWCWALRALVADASAA